MLQRKYFVASLLLVLLGGCNQVQSGTPNNSHTLVAQQPAEALESKLKKGMSYADFRKLVVDGGWTPVIDPECKPNVVGADFEKVCGSDPELASCKICDHLPELSSCSGDAYCGMYFSKDSKKLHVVTFGDFSDWNVSGEDSQLSVDGWDFATHRH